MTSPTAIEATAPRRGMHPLLPAFALGLAAFLTQFDVTSVVVAMPAIGDDLAFDVAGYAWVMDALSLALTASLLAAGVLADRHGRRRAMLGGNLVFALASAACGLAGNGPVLWAGRAAQGIGAAFVITGGIALIANAYPKPDERARAFGLMGVISGVAMALGPSLGGAIAAVLGWRFIFLVNVPICAAIAVAVPRLVAEAKDHTGKPLDPVGIALLTFALAVTIEALLQGRGKPIAMTSGLTLGAGFALAFGLRERQQTRPMFDPKVFANPAMLGVAALLIAVSVGYWTVLVYLPLLMGQALRWPTGTTGPALLAATVPMLILPPLGARLAQRLGWRTLFAAGLAIMLMGDVTLAAATAGAEARLDLLVCGMVAIGVGAALVHPQLSGAVVALVPQDQAGMASAVTIVMRQAGFGIGIAALGAVLRSEASAASYAAAFAVAAASAAGGALAARGALAALILLPASAGRSRT